MILFKSVDNANKLTKPRKPFHKTPDRKEMKSVTRRISNYKKIYCVVEDITIFILVFGFVTKRIINMFGLPRSRARWWIYLLIHII